MMISSGGKDPYDWLIIVCIVSVIAQALHWFIAIGPVVHDSREAHFLARRDAGSFLVPAACLYFRGIEDEDFVRASGTRRFRELCWYTRGSFKRYFPEFRHANEAEMVRRQVERIGVDVFRRERAETNFARTIRRSLHLGLISLMLIAYCYYVTRYRQRQTEPPPAKGRWQWRRRARWHFGR
jgi:hypothetical protein